jgi:hypothetical protein
MLHQILKQFKILKQWCDVIIHVHRLSHAVTQIDDFVGNVFITLLFRHEGQESFALREENFQVFATFNGCRFRHFDVSLLTTIIQGFDDHVITQSFIVALNRSRGKEVGERV